MIKQQGYLNAQSSLPYLKYGPCSDPPHILTVLAKKLGVREDDTRPVKREKHVRSENEDAKLTRLLDLEKLAKVLVKGVESEMQVLEDGTMDIVRGSEKIPRFKTEKYLGDDVALSRIMAYAHEGKESQWTRPESRAQKSEATSGLTTTSEKPDGKKSSSRSQRRNQLRSKVLASTTEPTTQVRRLVNNPELVDGAWVFPKKTTRPRQRLANAAWHDTPREHTKDRPTQFLRKQNEPESPMPEETFGEASYSQASFDWLLNVAPSRVDDAEPRKAVKSAEQSSRSVPRFQWTPKKRDEKLKEEEEEFDKDDDDEWDYKGDELESLEKEVERLFPDQGEGDLELDDDEDFVEKHGETSRGRREAGVLGR
jgi:hypothetical protein